MLQPIILSGGSGSRLWPLSREQYPKQFLSLIGKETLFQQAIKRLDGLADVADPIIVCNEIHRFLVVEQVRQLKRAPAIILLESVGRSTAPALTLAALWLVEHGRDDLVIVMPSDHVIQNISAFQASVTQGIRLAEAGQLVTFGVVPTAPATGYGYIRRGSGVAVAEFVEKPDAETAKRYVASGNYLWNSGIFLMQASVWLKELQCRRPDIARACEQAFHQGERDEIFYRPDAIVFSACPNDSIDYAVMERTDRASVVSLDAGWSDVGDWASLQEISTKDAQGNASQGDVVLHNTVNSLLIAKYRLVAGVGLRDTIIVETADAVLVAHKDRVQSVKDLVNRLRQEGRAECEAHRKVDKPWGSYDVLDSGERFQVKRITVNPGAALSLQMHRHRAEHWVVVRGTATVTRGDEILTLNENQSAYIALGVVHRLENHGFEPLEIIEVQSGSYLGEDDIVRLEDPYRRAPDETI